MPFDSARARQLIQDLDWKTLFVEVLGWSQPQSTRPVAMAHDGATFQRCQVAQLSGVLVFEVTADDGPIPSAKTCAALHKEVAALHHENLLIFTDRQRTQSLWYWVKRQDGKTYPRDHLYVRGQPGDLFLGKLAAMVVDMSELDEAGNVPVAEVARRLKQALDVERVTKRFYKEYEAQHIAFLQLIQGIDDERDRRWYASVLLNRLMFVYFLQKKHFIDNGNGNYLQDKLSESRAGGKNRYYRRFLRTLFFEGFAKPADQRSPEARALLGEIKYLNGGLFLTHPIEERYPDIDVPDEAFDNLLALFGRYSWHLDDTPGGKDDEINPDVLGYIFEKYINQKEFGAYYTRPEITEYLCERTIHRLVLDGVNSPEVPGVAPARQFESVAELLIGLDAPLCRQLLHNVLPNLTLLDPACGSGAFLVAAMKTLINVYAAVVGRIEFLNNRSLSDWLRTTKRDHPSIGYFIKKRIITDNLFGVDIMEEATEIAKLRLFLALVAVVDHVDQLEPLPNIDFNILAGNSLIGLMHVEDEEFNRRNAQGNLFRKSYQEILKEKNRLIEQYRHTSSISEDLTALRDNIQRKKAEALETLDQILLDEFSKHLGIKFDQATWDAAKNTEGKPTKRALTLADIRALRPFHWGYEFDEILNKRGGFDAIITNPPWEVFKPYAKEFFDDHSNLVSANKMRIEDFEKEKAKLLRNSVVRGAWLDYLSRFPHVSAFFRSAPQYKNQISIVNGKKAGTDINLYKLFLEQCFNLLTAGGQCGIIVPSGIYTDLGSKQLRELLFSETEVDSVFGLSNERYIFEGVHHSWRICLLSFEKGRATAAFTAGFRVNPREAVAPDQLEHFLHSPSQHVRIPVALVRRLAPESLSVMEFRTETDLRITEQMLRFPRLDAEIEGQWNLVLCNEFHMTNDSHLYKTAPGRGRLPLCEGKMIHQFDHHRAEPKYWLDEEEARKELLAARLKRAGALPGAPRDIDPAVVKLDYESYRLAFRDVARSTDERTLIAAVLPRRVFCPHTITLESVFTDQVLNGQLMLNVPLLTTRARLFLLGVFNSFTVDYLLRQRVATHVSFFFVYNLPVPRLDDQDPLFNAIAQRAAQLTCTTPEFDDLAKEIGLRGHEGGATDPAERARLRAELDGLIAHLYGLTEEEFAYILTTFPVVPQAVKDAALEAYRAFAPPMADPEIGPLLVQGEGPRVEFKSSARWDLKENKKNGDLEKVIVKTVAGFLNTDGGTLLIGVDDDATIIGLQHDYQTVHKKSQDGYELFLHDLLLNAVGKDLTPQLGITFHTLDRKGVAGSPYDPAPDRCSSKTAPTSTAISAPATRPGS